MLPLTIDIWTDISCPWCFIGKKRFEAAAQRFESEHPDGPSLDVTYRSFQIAPHLPDRYDSTVADFLRDYEGLAPERVAPVLARVTEAGQQAGLAYDFAAVRQTNTRLAHELAHAAKAADLQSIMVERLYRAYFLEGRHLGRVDELISLAEEVGLDRGEIGEDLANGRHTAAVRADIARATDLGIRGVPFFVVDDAFGMSGAQSSETVVAVLERAVEARRAPGAPS